MKIKINDIKDLLSKAASKIVTPEEAEYFAQEYIDCTLRMYPDVNPIEQAVSDIEEWTKQPNTKYEITNDKQGTFFINFNGLSPALKLKFIHDELEKRSKANGVAMFGLNNSSVTDWLKLWTNGLAKRGMIAIYMFNGGGGSAVPFGGTVPIFGTNPLSYAIPTLDNPILVDMATSESAFYKYKRARKNNVMFRDNTFVDENGVPTNNPQEGYVSDDNARILPMGGGYRGYNIIFLVEVLTGALVRSKMGAEKNLKYTPNEYGGFLIVIDVASLTDLNEFKKSVSSMCDSIRSQKPAQNIEKVFVPGDNSLSRSKELLAVGELDISNELIDKLHNI